MFVRAQRDGRYCINISEHYCSHWEDIHAFREALQNWMDAWKARYPSPHKLTVKFQENKALKLSHFYLMVDGVKNTQNFIEYDEEEKTLRMVNEGCFKVENMLMGASTSRHQVDALGQFGEGMKLFFMILLKFNYRLFIESGSYIYAPSLERWEFKEYNSRVLYVTIRDRQRIENTVLTIRNVEKAKFDDFRHLSLMLVNDYEVIEYPKMRLIVSNNPRLGGGKIFKKQILVGMRYPLNCKYSFDFEDIILGRDRDSINDPEQLRTLCSQLFAYILNDYATLQQKPSLINELPNILNEVIRLIKLCEFVVYRMHGYTSVATADRIYRQYLREKNVGELYPVNSSADQSLINQTRLRYGLPESFYPVEMVNCHFNANLRRSGKYYLSITQKVQRDVLDKSKRELNDLERNQLAPIKNGIAALLPEINNFAFKVQEMENLACYQDGNCILINKNELPNTESFKRKLIKLIVKDV